MENKETEYLDGDGDDFTIFLFSKKPMKPNTVKLQLNPENKDIHIGLHIFQELLMIFTLGAKYLFSKNEKLDITKLEQKDIDLMNEYFKSIGFTISVEIFTISENSLKWEQRVSSDNSIQDSFEIVKNEEI